MHPAARHFKKVDPILHAAITGTEWTQLQRRRARFAALCRIIVGQQVSVKAAAAIYARFVELFPRKRPNAEIVCALHDNALRGAGLSASKVAAVRDLAEKVQSGALPLRNLHRKDDAELTKLLTDVRGIGQWSAEMFMIFSLGREDVFSSGDLGLRNAIQQLYGLPAPPTPQEAEVHAERWTPYRSYACRILWQSLNNAPQ